MRDRSVTDPNTVIDALVESGSLIVAAEIIRRMKHLIKLDKIQKAALKRWSGSPECPLCNGGNVEVIGGQPISGGLHVSYVTKCFKCNVMIHEGGSVVWPIQRKDSK